MTWNSRGHSPQGLYFSSAGVSRAKVPSRRLSAVLTGTRAFDNQSDRTVIDQRNGHMRLEDAGFDAQPGAPRGGHKMLVQCARLIGARRTVEARAAPLAAIAIQRELRDGEHRAAGFGQA